MKNVVFGSCLRGYFDSTSQVHTFFRFVFSSHTFQDLFQLQNYHSSHDVPKHKDMYMNISSKIFPSADNPSLFAHIHISVLTLAYGNIQIFTMWRNNVRIRLISHLIFYISFCHICTDMIIFKA